MNGTKNKNKNKHQNIMLHAFFSYKSIYFAIIMLEALSILGAFGPYIMAAGIIAENIINQTSYFKIGVLLLWQPLNVMINCVLKEIINEDRPAGSKNINKLEAYIDEGSKGMPSGHAQVVGSELMLAYLSNSFITKVLMMFQTGLTVYQRYSYKKHTISQLIIGFIIGIIYSYIFWLWFSSID